MNNSYPTVSVIIPCWNLEKYLEETLRSVASQTWESFEVIMVDDASTDRSWEVMKDWENKDKRFQAIKQPVNKGVVEARNAALSVSKGEFIAMLDGDDLFTSDAIEHRMEVARKYPDADVIATDYSWFEDQVITPFFGHVTLGPRARQAFASCHSKGLPQFLDKPFDLVAETHFAWVGATLVRRIAMEKLGFFEPNFRTQEDTLLWLRLANQGPFVYSPKVTAHYRQRQGSIVHSLKEPNEYHYLKVLNWVRARPEFINNLQTIDSLIAQCHYISAVHFRKRYEHHPSTKHAASAIKGNPLSGLFWREFVAA